MKGVVSNPNKEMNQDFMDDWLDNYVEPIPCNHGDVVEGVITMVSSKSILIDIGGKCDALVQPREVEQMSPEELRTLRPGQVIHVYVIDDAEDKETIIVSLAKAAEYNDWIKARNLMENKKNIVLKVVDVNKGGLIVEFMGLRGFVPGSQLLPNWRVKQDTHSTEHRWDALVGEELTLRIIEVTPEHNRLILSERVVVDGHDKKHSVLADLSSGDEVWGIVSNLVPFGAFVNVKGVDGLVHISELSWHRVNRPSDVLRVGQKVKVYVLDVDLERERLSLSVKRMKTDPWANVDNICKEGQSVEVEIVNMVSFGAFAALVDSPGVEGLIHVSEMSDKPVQRPEDAVRLGEHYMARIISLQQDERRIAFSLKQVGAEVSVKHHESHDVSTA